MLDGLKGGPLLVLDSGNALFRNGGGASPEDLKRAHLLLSVMGRLGTRAMAVGVRDLSGGAAFLAAETRAAGIRALSANLTREGRRLFEASVVLEVGPLRVAVVGVSAPGPIVPGEARDQAGPTLPAVKAALAALGKRDLTVLLAATSFADAQQLAEQLSGQVDLVLQSGEFRGTIPPQRIGRSEALLLASGQKGQAVGLLTLALGAGPLLDLSAREREAQQASFVASQRAAAEARLRAATSPGDRADLQAAVAQLRQREAQLALAAAPPPPGARTLKLEWVPLAASVADDPAIKAEVLTVEPSYQGLH